MMIFTLWYLHVVYLSRSTTSIPGAGRTLGDTLVERAARERYGLLLRRYARMYVTRWLPLRGVEPERSPSGERRLVRDKACGRRYTVSS